jgi:hypothetical protein
MKTLKYTIEKEVQERIFNEYISGKPLFATTLNILMNDRSCQWYSLIGKYFNETMSDDFFKKQGFNLFDKDGKLKESDERFLGTLFICEYLNEITLKKMFGNPIKHSEFGEGFDRKRKYDYCSYIIQIDDKYFHIGFDHRGTSIECENNLTAKELFEYIKKIIDYFKASIM